MRFTKESLDRFFDYDFHVESRTLYIGGNDKDELDGRVAERAIKAIHIFQGMSPEKDINIILNSFGGCWFSGMAIYDSIAACPCQVNATVIGSAMSMGSIILQAADSRIIYPNATMMVHDGYETRVNDTPLTFQNWADYSKVSQQRMYEIYAGRSGRTVSFWKKKCSSDLILTASAALKLGLVDSIFQRATNE